MSVSTEEAIAVYVIANDVFESLIRSYVNILMINLPFNLTPVL